MMRCCLALAVSLAAACGHPAGHDNTTPHDPAARGDDDPSCPMLVRGTSVTVEDTDKGASLVFVTTGDVENLRTRAKFLALAHTKRGVDPAGTPPGNAMSDMVGTKSTADESDVDRGAKVTFIATTEADVAPLQQELRMHAQHLANA